MILSRGRAVWGGVNASLGLGFIYFFGGAKLGIEVVLGYGLPRNQQTRLVRNVILSLSLSKYIVPPLLRVYKPNWPIHFAQAPESVKSGRSGL